MLIFAIIEIWANIQPIDTPSELEVVSDDASPPQTNAPTALPPIENVLDSFSRKPIFSRLDSGGGDDGKPKPAPGPDWEAYTRENVNLIGTSVTAGEGQSERREAILVDGKTGRMHFLQIGQKLVIEKRELELKQIESDSVMLSDGVRTVAVK
jgi:hypothetical protein